jgi:hypothetical protein
MPEHRSSRALARDPLRYRAAEQPSSSLDTRANLARKCARRSRRTDDESVARPSVRARTSPEPLRALRAVGLQLSSPVLAPVLIDARRPVAGGSRLRPSAAAGARRRVVRAQQPHLPTRGSGPAFGAPSRPGSVADGSWDKHRRPNDRPTTTTTDGAWDHTLSPISAQRAELRSRVATRGRFSWARSPRSLETNLVVSPASSAQVPRTVRSAKST